MQTQEQTLRAWRAEGRSWSPEACSVFHRHRRPFLSQTAQAGQFDGQLQSCSHLKGSSPPEESKTKQTFNAIKAGHKNIRNIVLGGEAGSAQGPRGDGGLHPVSAVDLGGGGALLPWGRGGGSQLLAGVSRKLLMNLRNISPEGPSSSGSPQHLLAINTWEQTCPCLSQ